MGAGNPNLKSFDPEKFEPVTYFLDLSVEPEEGEVQIHEFLLKHPDQVELLPLKLDIGLPGNQTYWEENLNPMLRHSRRIFPELGHDGFFVTLMKKVTHMPTAIKRNELSKRERRMRSSISAVSNPAEK